MGSQMPRDAFRSLEDETRSNSVCFNISVFYLPGLLTLNSSVQKFASPQDLRGAKAKDWVLFETIFLSVWVFFFVLLCDFI